MSDIVRDAPNNGHLTEAAKPTLMTLSEVEHTILV
jgi:hypothetical protein